MCQEQAAVSHSSSESGIISLDARLGVDGLPALQSGECVLSMLTALLAEGNLMHLETEKLEIFDVNQDPTHFPGSFHVTKLFVFEDKAAVIQPFHK